MFTVLALIVVAAMGFLLWMDRVNVIKDMKADIAKAVAVMEKSATQEAGLAIAALKKHL